MPRQPSPDAPPRDPGFSFAGCTRFAIVVVLVYAACAAVGLALLVLDV